MKLMHTTTTNLNTREFNNLSDKIIDSLYSLIPDIRGLYDIHINFIEDSWRIDFIPQGDNIPVIKVDTYTEYNANNQEVLKITPKNLANLPETLKFKDDDNLYDTYSDFISIFEFLLSLYDFEYKL